MQAKATARQEWAAMWPMPIVAMLGVMGSGILSYSSGVLIVPITEAFGWSRVQFSSGFAVQMVVMLVCAPFVGRAIDRFGPRRVALWGGPPYVVALAALGLLANGAVWQWQLLCVLQGVIGAFVSVPAWMTGLVTRFDASRGLAIAFALAGLALGGLVWPIAAALYLEWAGWRLTFGLLALSWGVVVLPLAFLFFYGAADVPGVSGERPTKPPAFPLRTVLRVLRTRAIILVIVAGALFGMVTVGLMQHIVPILRANGLTLREAAMVAGIGGLAALTGRIGGGFLLDRVPTRLLGAVAFSLPVALALMLLQGLPSVPLSIAAVVIFGLASGAETDLVTYLLSRRVPTAMFGSAYAVVLSVFAICAGMGPLLASKLYDLNGDYRLYLWSIVPMVLTGALLIWLVPSGRTGTVDDGRFDGAIGAAA